MKAHPHRESDNPRAASRPDRPWRERFHLVTVLTLPFLAGGAIGFGAVELSARTQTDSTRGVATQGQTDQDGAAVSFELGEVRSLDGSGNNVAVSTLGAAGSIYRRLVPANYADGIGEPETGPPERYLSNRIFNDTNQNIFSENEVTHWGFVWGQFIDHTIGNRETSDEDMTIAFDPTDPLESFTNDLGGIATTRSAAADGTGVDTTREQLNTVSSYIDGWAIYGGTDERLDWLRDGLVDGDPINNDATLLDVDGYLPTASARAGTEAPETDLVGRLFGDPESAVIAGDVRVNENIGLTAIHTLMLREHNRIVDALPARSRRGDEVPDRSTGPHRHPAVRHLQRVPAGDGSGSRSLCGL